MARYVQRAQPRMRRSQGSRLQRAWCYRGSSSSAPRTGWLGATESRREVYTFFVIGAYARSVLSFILRGDFALHRYKMPGLSSKGTDMLACLTSRLRVPWIDSGLLSGLCPLNHRRPAKCSSRIGAAKTCVGLWRSWALRAFFPGARSAAFLVTFRKRPWPTCLPTAPSATSRPAKSNGRCSDRGAGLIARGRTRSIADTGLTKSLAASSQQRIHLQ